MRYRYSYYYGRNSFLGFLTSGTGIIISLGIALFFIICMWRIFTKAGRAGWKSLIPIYSAYVQWDIAWEGSKYLTIIFGSIGVGILSIILGFLGQFGAIIILIVGIVWSIYMIVLSFKMAIRMAHRFGKSTAFGVLGLIFFPVIGYPILGFGSADYKDARDMGDGILRSDYQIDLSQQQDDEYWKRISNIS